MPTVGPYRYLTSEIQRLFQDGVHLVGAKEAELSQVHLVAILEGQTEMQQEFVEFRKRSTEEIEALRQKNSCLKRKVEAEIVTDKAKEKDAHWG